MADTKATAEALVEEGLKFYSQGRLDEALARWRVALEAVPDHHRAREYLKYVEDNRAALEESFRVARAPEPAAESRGVPAAETAAAGHAGSIEVEFVAIPPSESAPTPEPDPSFVRFASEIECAAAAVEKEVTNRLFRPTGNEFETDDYTPRIDLGELKAKVAATKHRLSQEMSTIERSSAPPIVSTTPRREDETPSGLGPPPARPASPADLDTRPVPRQAAERQPARTPPSPSPAVGASPGRGRRATPLTLISGGATPALQDFEPLEETPVGVIPEPARLVQEDTGIELLSDSEQAEAELADPRDSATPSKIRRRHRPSDIGLAATGPQQPAVSRTPTGDRGTVAGLGPMPGDPTPPRTPHLADPTPPRTTLPLGFEGPQLTPPGGEGERLEGMVSGARQLFEQGTFEGSLWLCERVLAQQPEHSEAKELLERNRQILLRQYQTQLPDKKAVPVVQVPQHEIVWHKLDHRAGFLLSRIDGQLSFEDLLDVCGMSEFEAYRILAQLLSQGVIGPRR